MREQFDFEVISITKTTDPFADAHKLKDELNRLGELGYYPVLWDPASVNVILQRNKEF